MDAFEPGASSLKKAASELHCLVAALARGPVPVEVPAAVDPSQLQEAKR
ncbi:hypothetical protein [Ramlibacter tataouinensis]|nr:hypothetical protein [Ramlibacter tataouinensis]